MGFCHLEPKLSGCNKEVAALYSDHYRQVRLYVYDSVRTATNVVMPSSVYRLGSFIFQGTTQMCISSQHILAAIFHGNYYSNSQKHTWNQISGTNWCGTILAPKLQLEPYQVQWNRYVCHFLPPYPKSGSCITVGYTQEQ